MTGPETTTELPREVLAVAPLVESGPDGVRLLGPCILLRARERVVGFASRALFASEGEHRVATRLDGQAYAAVAAPETTGRVGIVAFAVEAADWSADVVPLDPQRIGLLEHAKRGVPFVVGVAEAQGVFRRALLRVGIESTEASDWGGFEAGAEHRAHAREPLDEDARYEGAPLFSRHPASRVLDRPAETLAYGLARALERDERSATFAELVALPAGYGF